MSKELALTAIKKLQKTRNLLELTTRPDTAGGMLVGRIKPEDFRIPEENMLALKDYILTAPKDEVLKTIGISPIEEALFNQALHTEEEDGIDSEKDVEIDTGQSSASIEKESKENSLESADERENDDTDESEDHEENAGWIKKKIKKT